MILHTVHSGYNQYTDISHIEEYKADTNSFIRATEKSGKITQYDVNQIKCLLYSDNMELIKEYGEAKNGTEKSMAKKTT